MDVGIAAPIIAFVVATGKAVQWYLEVRQASLEIEAWKTASEQKDKIIENKNLFIEEQRRTIKIIEPNNGRVTEVSQIHRKYSTNIEKHDKDGKTRVFESDNFEDLECLENAKSIDSYVEQVKDNADKIKNSLHEYPSNKYI